MAEADIEVTKCEPLALEFKGEPKAHRLRWINNESAERKVTFANGVPALFLGSGSPPVFSVPPHGAIEFESDPKAYHSETLYGCKIEGARCGIVVADPKVIVVGP
jgi:hypothetical protein